MPALPRPDTPAGGPGLTRPADRVPLREKIALGFGFVASSGSQNVIHVFSNPVYNMTLGMSPALVSVLFFAQRLWSAMLDPVAGQVSDDFRSRFGRRRPLLALAIGPLSIAFAALWLVKPGSSGQALFFYVLGFSLLFYTARSFYDTPLVGLQMEATSDYHERTRLAGFTQIFVLSFAIIPDWLFALSRRSFFRDPTTGLHVIGCVFGTFFLAAGLLPAFLTRERRYNELAGRPRRRPLRESLRVALSNRPLALIAATQLVVSSTYMLVGPLGLYLNYYFVYAGDIRRGAVMEAWNATAYQVAAVGSVFAYRRLSLSIGKRRTLQVALGVLVLGSLAKLVLFQPAHPWLMLPIWAANGAGIAGIAVMTLSMLSDAADFEEWRTGVRSEGIFASIRGLADTVGYSFGALLSGFILVAIGFDAALGGAQPAACLLQMRILYTAVPLAGAIAAILIIDRYPLSAEQSGTIKAELARRGV
jgi:GPH family glycoside/pentoside/hexuronide:cation symporter